jgi:hypothetical protein
MYCQKHDKVGCSTCMTEDHRYLSVIWLPFFEWMRVY